MALAGARAERFTYSGYELDEDRALLECRYQVDDEPFTEVVHLAPGGRGGPSAEAAARLYFLLAGVSYYKTAAPSLVDLGDHPSTADERRFLATFYREGLAEFAYRNRLDLGGLEVVGPDRDRPPTVPAPGGPGRPLVPFGGGIDSIVTAEAVARRFPEAALFVVGPAGDRFEALEAPAAATGLPVLRAERELDEKVLHPAELGYLNGHVPVTGILSALAVLSAVRHGRDAVVMANEWSASSGNLDTGGHVVNHQWSKGEAFESAWRELLAATFAPGPAYFSYLRSWSELAVARRFAGLPRYHRLFRSCNRAFALDRRRRLDAWCGRCDKCCFIDLVLAPFLSADELAAVFDETEPLAEPDLAGQFRVLLGLGEGTKPFECVGDVDECRAALALTALRPDRAADGLVASLARELSTRGLLPAASAAERLFRPLGRDAVPDDYAADDLLV
ncbi:MAG TPA: hypothetical protein VK277_04570 [Acidimicrobiales bacterium]|nr:hypothetical protein [Acidimicrobiales bacterium]